MLQVNSYIEPADFTGLGTLGWCPVIYGKVSSADHQQIAFDGALVSIAHCGPTRSLSCCSCVLAGFCSFLP